MHNSLLRLIEMGDASSSSSFSQEHLDRLSGQISQLEANMSELREQASRLPSLSPATLIQLDKTEERLIALKSNVEEEKRRRSTTNGHNNHNQSLEGDAENDEFNAVLPKGWERGLTPKERIPYYLNHSDESTQWDHPLYSELMCRLLEVNTVRYSAYRLALKLRRVQQRLCLDLLDLETALFAFDEHGLTADRHDLAIQVPEIVLVLSHIYQALRQEEPESVESVPLCVDLCLNWLLNVYDSARVGQLRVLSFKLGVLLLCRGPLTEKYLHLFKLVASANRRLAPRQLGLLLFDSIQVPKVLGEVASFGGSNVEPSVRSCFALGVREGCEPHSTVDAKHFLRWLRQEPQSMVWLPVLHRLAAAETARHNVKCRVCKAYPIVGFRYHCLKCFNFDLCHNCFFLGQSAKGHKPEHPMQEYCTSTGTSVNLKNLGQAFRNSFRTKKYFKKKQQKLGYLPVASPLEGPDVSSPPSLSPNLSAESRDLLATNDSSQNDSLVPKVVNLDLNKSDNKPPSEIRKAAPMADGATNLDVLSDDDEHSVIARFCRKLNDIEGGVEDKNKSRGELEKMIGRLEEQNRELTDEYDRLRAERLRQDSEKHAEEEDEAKKLLQHSNRMESKMKILEEHNKQLEEQLNRLRHLLEGEDGGGASPVQLLSPSHTPQHKSFGTLQAKNVTAALLQDDGGDRHLGDGAGEGSIRKRREPPKRKKGGRDSLDLSDVDAARVSDSA